MEGVINRCRVRSYIIPTYYDKQMRTWGINFAMAQKLSTSFSMVYILIIHKSCIQAKFI